MNLFDIAIIGASISGASLAACLGMEAVEVALIDKDRFPRRKACGEGLSNIAIDALHRMRMNVDHALEGGVPLQVGPVNSTRRPYVSGSTLLIGDAVEMLDPVAGMGMTHGILTAEIAAETLRAVVKDGADAESEFCEYARKAEAMTRPFRGFTRLTASLLRSPARRILVPTLASTPLPAMIRCALDDSTHSIAKSFSLPGQFLSRMGA